ncbi:uncharacterized protein BP01DRAFT_188335 [Aspergillus saccharolyticus JOP 1030-1]|uniref:TRAF-type domain-containing protein n=1 Tax=Aspergillus saccharolyticus JOP 1030-1 TaxID=1450539 RepID=A0A318Z3V2_9EURO|nr:hypothetical protein BP01DRAFT_188335 [Aspergillus saccharolyticus JOP 1030-1]PYH40997.1 hypothetical protein BP01DRAFT_188335 [Aspergillus saccharolyticus JOP 1030-1]
MKFSGNQCPFCSCLLRSVVRQRHFTRCDRAEEWHPCPSCHEKIQVRDFGLHQASCGKIANKNHGHCSALSALASQHPVLIRTTEHPSEQIPWRDGQGNTSVNTMTHDDVIIQMQHKYTALQSDFMLLVEKLHEFGAVLMSCRPMPSDVSLHRSAIPESRNAPALNSPLTVEPQTLSTHSSPGIQKNSNPLLSGIDAALSSKPFDASMLANHSVPQDKGKP